jgi:hypothetical protein
LQGSLGEKGSKGEIGEQGAKGTKGEEGEQGPRGEIGDQGEIGLVGEIGDQGAKGRITLSTKLYLEYDVCFNLSRRTRSNWSRFVIVLSKLVFHLGHFISLISSLT